MSIYTCALCGIEFSAAPSDRPRGVAYCSQSCASRARESARGHSSEQRACERCGKVISRPSSRFPGRTAYCSRECFQNRKRPNRSGAS